MTSFSRLDDDALVRSLHAIVATHRNATAALVGHLGEVEERRIHLSSGFPSMFQYCVTELAFSEDEACRRIEAARLARRFPRVVSMLETGTISLSVVGLLKEHLTAENATELFDGVAGSSARRAKEWLAARFPLPDLPEVLRKLPERRAVADVAGQSTSLGLAVNVLPEPVPEASPTLPVDLAASQPGGRAPVFAPVASHPVGSSHSSLEPLSRDRFALKVTISRATREKLDLARNLRRHKHPKGELETLLDDALDALLERIEKTKLRKTQRPRRSKQTPRSARIGSATRREVAEREDGRCSFVAADGRRCGATAFLEYDHVKPAALGGGTDAGNVRLLCRAHNRFAAEEAYGRDFVEGKIARARAERTGHITRDSRG